MTSTIDKLLSRADRGPGEVRIDHFARRQAGSVSPPTKGRLQRNSRQQAEYDRTERERLARRRNSSNL